MPKKDKRHKKRRRYRDIKPFEVLPPPPEIYKDMPPSMAKSLIEYDRINTELQDFAWDVVTELSERLVRKHKVKKVYLIGHLGFDIIPNPLMTNLILIADSIPNTKYLSILSDLVKKLPPGFTLDLLSYDSCPKEAQEDIEEFGYVYQKVEGVWGWDLVEPDPSTIPPPKLSPDGKTLWYEGKNVYMKYTSSEEKKMLESQEEPYN